MKRYRILLRSCTMIILILATLTNYFGGVSNLDAGVSNRYLGVKNGSISLTDKKISQYAKYLNLKTSMPTIEGLYYANGTYLATTTNNDIYISKNLKKWKKTKRKTSGDYIILTDPPRGFLLICNNKYYASENGNKWTNIAGIGNFFNNKPEAFFKNKIIGCTYRKSEKSKIKKLGKYKAIITNKVGNILNEGNFLLSLENFDSPANGDDEDYENYDSKKVRASFDGTTWKYTGVQTYAGYSSSIKHMPKYNNKKIIEFYTYNCDDTIYYYSYKVKSKKVTLKKEDMLKHFNGNLTPEKSLFNICTGQGNFGYGYGFSYDDHSIQMPYLDKGAYQETFEKNVFQNDILMLQDFIGNDKAKGSTMCILNDKFYYFGKYGGIIEINKKFKQRWVGLYPRKTWNRKNMAKTSKGGKIGIFQKEGVLWYANTKKSGNKAYYQVFSSIDGIRWKYEFTKHSKINVKELKSKY